MSLEKFLLSNGIDFITQGKNVKWGNVNIHCPLCGYADPSHHLGMDLRTGKWGCWRNAAHRGRNPYFILSTVTGKSQSQLKEEVEFEQISSLNPVPQEKVDLPPVYPIRNIGARKQFWQYMESRGFPIPLLKQFKIEVFCVTAGSMAGRVIFPFYAPDGLLAGLLGRSIYDDFSPRYDAKGDVRGNLWEYHRLRRGGEKLIVTEGVFDALSIIIRTDYYATPILGIYTSERQMELLAEVAAGFDQIIILLDNDTLTQPTMLQKQLSFLHPIVKRIPPNIVKIDPGKMSGQDLKSLLES
jgi:hypothetical protein